MDVFNLLDRQAITTYDQRYNENGDACGGVPFGLCAGDFVDEDGNEHRGSGSLQHDGPTLNPIGQLPALTPSNPSFLRDGPQRRGVLGPAQHPHRDPLPLLISGQRTDP